MHTNRINLKISPQDYIDLKKRIHNFKKYASFITDSLANENELFTDEVIIKAWQESIALKISIPNYLKIKLDLIKNAPNVEVKLPKKVLSVTFYNKKEIEVKIKQNAQKLKMKLVTYNTIKINFIHKTINLFSNSELESLKSRAILENKNLKEYIADKIL